MLQAALTCAGLLSQNRARQGLNLKGNTTGNMALASL